MASITRKKKGNQFYYYVVQSARVNGKPRIVHQTYLGNAERVIALVQDRTAPVPLEATTRSFGLPGALWLAAEQTGIFEKLLSMWPVPRSGPSPAHYLLLAAINRICKPGPKTDIAKWYSKSILHSIWGFPPERFTSQAFWDSFEQILPQQSSSSDETGSDEEDPLERAAAGVLGLWKEKQLVSHRLLAYDTSNFHTYIASSNTRTQLAQRGHNKQGRHNLRQVGLSYVLDAENGLSVCHHVYPGNVSDSAEFPVALDRITRMLDKNQIPRNSVTLVMDKGSAGLPNTLELESADVGWISALPWNQAPADLRELPVEQLPLCSSDLPGVHATAKKEIVHGREYLCVVRYSAPFASEQLQSISTSISKVMQSLRRLSIDLKKPKSRATEDQIRTKIQRWTSAQFLSDVIGYKLEQRGEVWSLQFDLDTKALQRLIDHRLGRTVLLTNRMDWTAEQVAAAYAGQQAIEQVFRGFKDGDWLGWSPMYHWTDSKIRIHAFYCMLGVSLLHYVRKQAQTAWPDISIEQLLEELSEIEQYDLLYPPLGDKGPNRIATVLSKRTLIQQALSKALHLDQLCST